MRNRWVLVLFIGMTMVAGCQRRDDVVIPTLIDLDAISTENAVTAAAATAAAVPTSTPTRSAPTLPPTFTPTIEPSVTPTDPALAPTLTPHGFSEAGTIYFIFNSDSIASLAADGTREDLLFVGGPYSDLTLSPDGELLTYVAPGVGGGLDVWVSNRDGTYIQQVSCVAFPIVRSPAWSHDGQRIAFLAAPGVGAPMELWVADFAGSSTCPSGNNQRVLVRTESTTANSVTWGADNARIFFNPAAVEAYDLITGQHFVLTFPSGFGPDYELAHHPTQGFLMFLRTTRITQTGQITGRLVTMETDVISDPVEPRDAGYPSVRSLSWSRDGEYLLITTDTEVIVLNDNFGSAGTGVRELTQPDATFSPNADRIAFTGYDDEFPGIEQIFVAVRTGRNPVRITSHADGVISNLVWIEG